MKCYLAHPVTDYGGTERQKRAIAAIEAKGWTVENPDQPLHQELYRQHGMEHFTELVKTCGSLAFARFPGGMIGAGVAREIETALLCGIPVYDASSGELEHSGIMMPYPVLTVEQTRELLAALRQNHLPDLPQAAPQTRPASVLGGVPTEAELVVARRWLREKPSTSYIQRMMGIGYNRASAIMETLENEGFISKPNAAGKRTVLAVSRPVSGGENG